jgi:hypothetical protein
MAYDIYGNNLRRGYCEVHPQVHEEYPCSLCYAEEKQMKDRRRQEDNQRYEQAVEVKSFEQLQHEWGESTCGKSIEKYIYDELTKQL